MCFKHLVLFDIFLASHSFEKKDVRYRIRSVLVGLIDAGQNHGAGHSASYDGWHAKELQQRKQ
jgi:hypothetical protein